MSRGLSLTPCGLVIDHVEAEADGLHILARPAAKSATCPRCSGVSARVHSRYQRSLSDLPWQGRTVRLKLLTRRFRCVVAECGQKIFTERLEATASRPFARRTSRLEGIVHHLGLALGLALGGRPGQSFARRLLLPVSKDTLLRTVRREAPKQATEPQVVGIDDWAWKRGHRYGTIVCDLEKHRIIDILPDREAAAVSTWLAAHPTIKVIARDRGAGYIQAATEGRLEAIQVADRWHLMENASAAFLPAVQRSLPAIRSALGTDAVDPKRLTCAERRQHSSWLRRKDENAAILELAKQGAAIKEIVRRTGGSRKVIRQIVRGGRTDMFRTRMNSLEPFIQQLEAAWENGCRNGAALWRQAKAAGFAGGLRVVTEWANRRRKEEGLAPGDQRARKPPSARNIARMMATERGRSPADVVRMVAQIEKAMPDLATARDLMHRFHRMIQHRKSGDLESWINEAKPGLLPSFATGIISDRTAAHAALTQPWSNGQTEGQNTKLKLVKQQMYGRAKLDLLRARLLGVP